MSPVSINIGGLVFQLNASIDQKYSNTIAPFITTQATPDIVVNYEEDAGLSEIVTDISSDETVLTVRYHPDIASRFTTVRGCLMYLPMERILLNHERFILHASFVTSPWGGLLFTADSGVGKSTQAELWKLHRGSRVINGDRAILSRERCWKAHGSVYAGSSDYYVNESCEIRAIILLEQGSENRLTPVPTNVAFPLLLLQVSMNRQSSEDVDRLCDLVMDAIASVPVYRLCCTPDARAVDILAAELEKGTADE